VLNSPVSAKFSNQINTSLARIRRHYITPYLASSEECELLSRLPDPMSVLSLSLSLSLPLFLAGFFPPVNTARLVCGTRDLHVSRRPATVRWYHGFVWREAWARARPGSASSRLLYVEKALAGAGRMPAKAGQSVTKDARGGGVEGEGWPRMFHEYGFRESRLVRARARHTFA